jgi:hypothetical protein
LNRILPREWHCAIKRALTHQVCFKTPDGIQNAYTESVLPMGNGLTFPVETLIFYSLIKAIGNLAGIDGIYSVYGDDLIYPSKLHRYVVRLFPDFNLQLNLDKTFVKFPFRESCGADFYRGCDVRPFFLQGERQQLTRSKYQAFLYKTINGLIRRWDPMEIPQTLMFLYTELAVVSNEIHRVPPDFPDTAGVKVHAPWDVPLGLGNLPWCPIYLSLDKDGNSRYKFSFLAETPGDRFVKTILPYYWLALQGLTDEVDPLEYKVVQHPNKVKVALRSSLVWRKHIRRRSFVSKGKRRSKKIVHYTPAVASRLMTEHAARTGFTFEWI